MGLSQGLAAGQGLATQPSECPWLHFFRRNKAKFIRTPLPASCAAPLLLAHLALSTLILTVPTTRQVLLCLRALHLLFLLPGRLFPRTFSQRLPGHPAGRNTEVTSPDHLPGCLLFLFITSLVLLSSGHLPL